MNFYTQSIQSGIVKLTIGKRLREERERLGFSQTAFGEVGDVTKLTQLTYEKDGRRPDAGYLAAIAAVGADVLYIVLGERSSNMPARDTAEQVLLDSYRRCNGTAQQNLIQTAVLLASNVSPAEDEGRKPAARVQTFHGPVTGQVAGGDVIIHQPARTKRKKT